MNYSLQFSFAAASQDSYTVANISPHNLHLSGKVKGKVEKKSKGRQMRIISLASKLP